MVFIGTYQMQISLYASTAADLASGSRQVLAMLFYFS